MEAELQNGYAFILEGATEKEFYLSLLQHFCQQRGAKLERVYNQDSPDVSYHLIYEDRISIIKFHTVNTITQMPRADKWFISQCVKKYSRQCRWYVFLCYDTDSYMDNISKFHQGDWSVLRKSLKEAKRIIDLSAAADIEDIMLQDLPGICSFLNCGVPMQLSGRNGKAKMKNLFRMNGKAYHEGSRAKDLIACLDMEKIISANVVPLYEIENIMFLQMS